MRRDTSGIYQIAILRYLCDGLWEDVLEAWEDPRSTELSASAMNFLT